MNQALMARGFSTSRIVVPEQNLSSGELRLVLQIGYIGTVRFAEGSDMLYWKNLFPFHEGDILNVRDIEQGIEQAKRLPSQDISVKLLPSDQPQRTDVVLTVKRGKNFYSTISVDDSGLEDTGKLQWYTSIGIDQPFHKNDLLRIGMNLDGAQDGYEKGTRGHNISLHNVKEDCGIIQTLPEKSKEIKQPILQQTVLAGLLNLPILYLRVQM